MANRSVMAESGRHDRGSHPRVVPLGGERTVSAILPSGRVVWLSVAAPLTSAVDIDRLAQTALHRAEHRRAAALSGGRALAQLSARVASDARRLTEVRLGRARRMRRRLIFRYLRHDRRYTAAARVYQRRVRRQIAIERTAVRRLARRDLWDKLVIISSLPLFAAYGQKGRPHAVNNVTLFLSLMMWIVGDEIVAAIFDRRTKGRYALHDADAWSYIAPFANLLAGWWLFSGRQHQRFITGHAGGFSRAAGAPAGTAILVAGVNLSPFIAPEHYPDFVQFERVPAVAAIRSIRWTHEGTKLNARVTGITARVTDIPTFVEQQTVEEIPGRLILRVSVAFDEPLPVPGAVAAPLVESLDVAWMVDTQDPRSSQT